VITAELQELKIFELQDMMLAAELELKDVELQGMMFTAELELKICLN
jgi:hypothetical protein